LKPKLQKTGDFGKGPESALGAGGREFESRRPDQSLYFQDSFEVKQAVPEAPAHLPPVQWTVQSALIMWELQIDRRGKFSLLGLQYLHSTT
jgi:hypothetical protein